MGNEEDIASIEGFNPNKAEHETFLDIDPVHISFILYFNWIRFFFLCFCHKLKENDWECEAALQDSKM